MQFYLNKLTQLMLGLEVRGHGTQVEWATRNNIEALVNYVSGPCHYANGRLSQKVTERSAENSKQVLESVV